MSHKQKHARTGGTNRATWSSVIVRRCRHHYDDYGVVVWALPPTFAAEINAAFRAQEEQRLYGPVMPHLHDCPDCDGYSYQLTLPEYEEKGT